MWCRVGIAGLAVLTACSGAPAKDRGAGDRSAYAARAGGAATAAGSSSPGADAPAPRVLIVGTSLTAGLGLDEQDAYPAVLQRLADSSGLRVRIVNAGLSGETSAGALRRLEWLLREPAGIVVIETGANDGLRGLNVDSTARNLRSIVGTVRGAMPGADLLLMQMEAPPNLGATYTRRFHAMYAQVATDSGLVLVPFLLEGVAGVERLNQPDGIHPTRDGARLVAGNVWKTLESRIRLLDRPSRPR